MKFFLSILFFLFSVSALCQTRAPAPARTHTPARHRAQGNDSATVMFNGKAYTIIRYRGFDSITIMRGTREKRSEGFMYIWRFKFFHPRNAPAHVAIDKAVKEEEKVIRSKQ